MTAMMYLCHILTESHFTLIGRPFSWEGHWGTLNPWVRRQNMEIKSVLSAGFGMPCRGDKGMENKGLTHLF